MTERIAYLAKQYFSNRATAEEVEELFARLREEKADSEPVRQWLQQELRQGEADPDYDRAHWQTVFESVLDKSRNSTQTPVRLMAIRKIGWAAAAVIVLLGAGAARWLTSQKTPSNTIAARPLATDVKAPATNRASLTLANGKTIYLDSTTNGSLIVQGNVQLQKLGDGRIAYSRTAASSGSPETGNNTLYNPRASRVIDLVLADGSHVWLNAGSSITYPVGFAGKDRTVSISGEAYFEVASDPSRPFFVTRGPVTVQVLGTRFDVNGYDDEKDLKVTLLVGSVRVSHGSGCTALLKPGQQAVTQSDRSQAPKSASISVKSDVDLDQVMAWKNGLFDFDNTDIQSALRQLAKWYDLDVSYQGAIPDIQLGGEMKRDLSLSQVLKGLSKIGLHARVEGKRLLILP
ncbi:MAG TPA: FecR domain-containing protein [Puia sp.]|nr:FecR domain-containing protein [Puia sp.]